MDYAIVLNACSTSFRKRAEEINGFLTSRIEGLLPGDAHGTGIIFYDASRIPEEEPDLLRLPVEELYLVRMDDYNPEIALTELREIGSLFEDGTGLYFFAGDYSGSELAVRFAARSGGSALTRVSRMKISGEGLYCDRPVYSNHLRGGFEMMKRPYCISIEHASAEPRRLEDYDPVPADKIVRIDATGKSPGFVKKKRFFREEKQDLLEHTDFVFVAGRGVGEKQNCERLRQRAEKLGAEFGVSRLAAMNGWAPMDRMIGVSGAITKPELCIIAAASGAAAFMAGIEKSGFILSVNTDPKAPVFGQSDVGVVEDYDAFTEVLVRIIEDEKNHKEGSREAL